VTTWREVQRNKLMARCLCTAFLLHISIGITASTYLLGGAQWHHILTAEDKADRDYFRKPHPNSPIHLNDFTGFSSSTSVGGATIGLSYAHAAASSLASLSQPRNAQKRSLRFKSASADLELPLKQRISKSWLGAYGEQGSLFGRGVKDFWSPSYGTFGDHNYGPMGTAYQTGTGYGGRTPGLPWNYSQPWDSGSPHPIWPVPPTAENSTLYSPQAIKWMTAPNMNLRDPIQPIGAGYGAQPMVTPQQQPSHLQIPKDYRKGQGETLMRFRGHQMLAGAEAVTPLAPIVQYDPKDPEQTLYINATHKEGAFPFDRTGNLASAPFTGYPAQWSSSPYPYGPSGEMPGTGGHPEPKPSWFWRMGGIPKTLPGYSRGVGSYYSHGGGFHPHAPSRTMMNHMSFWPGNVGLMTSKHPNYIPAVAAMRAAAMMPPSTGNDASGLGIGVAGPSVQGSVSRDHYNAVPLEPIPPPGQASQTVPATYTQQ